MSGHDGQSTRVTTDDSSLKHSTGADLLPDTSTYFDAWLASIKPSLAPGENLAPLVETFPHSLPTPGPPPVPGEFRFEGTLRVDCYITGSLRSQTGTLHLSETGEVETDLFVPVAIIDGLVRGDIRATERVELGSRARVLGDIETPSLAIQPGAVFEGRCHFVRRSKAAIKAENPPAPVETPRLSVVRTRDAATADTDGPEALTLVAAAGR